MSDKEDELSLEEAVYLLHRGKYHKPSVWTDSFKEFKTFQEANSQQVAYFRMCQTPTGFRYSEDSHSRVATALSGLLPNMYVERIEQDFERALFLVRSDCNYVSLREFLKIKRGKYCTEPRFVLSVLNFLSRLIPILTVEQIITELTPNSICFQGEDMRLCDYNLLFYPRNLRTNEEGLQYRYLREASSVVFELLSMETPSKSRETFGKQVYSLLEELKERETEDSGELFIKVVSDLLNNGIINATNLKLLTRRVIYESSSLLTESNVTVKDYRTESTVLSLSKNPTRNSSVMTKAKSIATAYRKRKIICSVVCLIMMLAAVGCVLLLFVFNEKTCRPNEYSADHRCYPCYDGCKNCYGYLNNQCTKCWGSLWLVKLNNQEHTGSCESHCIGQEYEGRECIVIPADTDINN